MGHKYVLIQSNLEPNFEWLIFGTTLFGTASSKSKISDQTFLHQLFWTRFFELNFLESTFWNDVSWFQLFETDLWVAILVLNLLQQALSQADVIMVYTVLVEFL